MYLHNLATASHLRALFREMKFNLNSTSKHDDDGTGDAAGKVEDVLKIVQIFASSSSGRNILVTTVSALHLLAILLNSFRLKFFFVIYSSILALARSSRLAWTHTII